MKKVTFKLELSRSAKERGNSRLSKQQDQRVGAEMEQNIQLA